MSNVSFRGVVKRYGDLTALDTLDLEIDDGAFVSLLGPSGSGKSTTLNLLAGLIDGDAGDILIGDKRVNDLSPDARDVAMVFQNYALYPHMTVYENLAFPLRAKGRRKPEAEIERAITEVSEMLGVFQLLDRFPKELSGGQQQRVALGRAMVRHPRVFLLDEPLSNLDARLRIRMRSDIKALHRRLNATIVYVTHDQAEAMTLSDKIAIFSHGRLQQYGTPSEIYNRPANVFVANFVGEREMNMMRGELRDGDRGPAFECPGVRIVLNGRAEQIRKTSGDVLCGVRMEVTRLGSEADADWIEGRVEQTELSGPDLVVQVAVSDDLTMWCRTDPTTKVAEGETVRLRLSPDDLHFFDPQSERSLQP